MPVTRSPRLHGRFWLGLGAALPLAASLLTLATPTNAGEHPTRMHDAPGPVCPPSCGEPLPPHPPCWPYCLAKDDIALVGLLGGGPPDAPDSPAGDTIPVAKSNGDGTFDVVNGDVGDFAAWSRSPGVVVLKADFDRDGHTDIALTGVAGWNTLPVAFSNGDGTFRVTNEFVGDFALWSTSPGVVVLTGDYNHDGRTDVALTGTAGWGSVPVAFSNGDGTFNVTNSSIADFAWWAAMPGAAKLAGDFDGDGRTDIAITGPAGWGSVPVAFSNGDGTFNVTNFSITDFAGWAAAPGAAKMAGDFNRDGLSDILLVGGTGWSSLPVAFSNGDGSFTVANVTDPNWNWVGQYISWPDNKRMTGDFNRDGRTDVAFAGVIQHEWGSSRWIFVGDSNGDGSFNWENSAFDWSDVFDVLIAPGATVITGDFNGDSRTDFAITGGEGWGSIPVLFSTGTYFHWTNKPVADFPAWAANPAAVKLSGSFSQN